MTLLHIIKLELVALSYEIGIAELASVKVFSIEDSHLVIRLDVLSVHKFFGQDFLAWMEIQ